MTIDKESPSWLIVKAHAEKAIEEARDSLERPMSVELAQMERGRIAALRDILKLADAKPAAPIENAPLY